MPVRLGRSAPRPRSAQPRSIANRPSRTAPIRVGNRMMRPAASQAASPEPIAIEIEKIARQVVTDLLGAAEHVLDQRRQQRQHDRADQPEPARHEGAPPDAAVVAQMLEQVAGRGRDVPTHHQIGRRLAGRRDEQARAPAQRARTRSSASANEVGSPPSLAASPPTMVPSRIAMKVAPSTSALPAGSSERARWSGRMPYLIGPNSEPITPNRNSATNRTSTECMREADDRDDRDADLGELEPLRHHRLVVAVGELAAERRQEEVRRDEDRGRERDQRLGPGPADLEQDQEDQRVLEEIVAECREELAPEQGREASGQQQGRGHGRCIRSIDRARWPMRRAILERGRQKWNGCA